MPDSDTAGQHAVKRQKGPGEMLPSPVGHNTKSPNMAEERKIFGCQDFQNNQEMAVSTVMPWERADSQPKIALEHAKCQKSASLLCALPLIVAKIQKPRGLNNRP